MNTERTTWRDLLGFFWEFWLTAASIGASAGLFIYYGFFQVDTTMACIWLAIFWAHVPFVYYFDMVARNRIRVHFED